jgi:hypothetical protein
MTLALTFLAGFCTMWLLRIIVKLARQTYRPTPGEWFVVADVDCKTLTQAVLNATDASRVTTEQMGPYNWRVRVQNDSAATPSPEADSTIR